MKVIKRNLLPIIILIFFLVFIIYGAIEYNNTYNFLTENYYGIQDRCAKMDITDDNYMVCCSGIETELPPERLDVISLAFYIINCTSFSSLLPFIPLLIIAMGIKSMYAEIKSGMFRNIILIEGYKKYFLKTIKRVWKYALFMPLIIFIVLIVSFVFSNHSFNFDKTLELENNILNQRYYETIVLFSLTYFLVLIFNSIFWLNLGIICIKKSRNYIVAIISGYILYIGYSLVLEITSGSILATLFRSTNIYGYVKPGNIWGYDGVDNLAIMILYSLLMVVISSFIIFLEYRKKESVIIENEI